MDGWTRRDFLARAGGTAGALALVATPGSRSGAQTAGGELAAAHGAGDLAPGDWASVRAQFPLRDDLRHFAAFILAAHPRPVAAAIERYRDELSHDTHAALEEHAGQEVV